MKAKTGLRMLLPAPLSLSAAAICRGVRASFGLARGFGLGARLSATGRRFPQMLLYFGAAPGDDLLCTAVLKELRKRGSMDVWMMSNYPELFVGTKDAAHVVPIGRTYEEFAKAWRRDLRHLEYAHYDGKDQSDPPRRHIIAELCARAGVVGAVTLRPYLALTEGEKAQAVRASGQIVVQSSGLAGKFPMRNKQWFPERFQAVVDALRQEFEFIQLGSATDPPLRHVKDLRGTTSIRESAAILHHARMYIGNVGFMMHLARAMECPSVIIYGGRETPAQSGYPCNVNVYTALPCAPCWRWNTCDFDRKCLTEITVDDVIRSVRLLLAKLRNPLIAETADISATAWQCAERRQ